MNDDNHNNPPKKHNNPCKEYLVAGTVGNRGQALHCLAALLLILTHMANHGTLLRSESDVSFHAATSSSPRWSSGALRPVTGCFKNLTTGLGRGWAATMRTNTFESVDAANSFNCIVGSGNSFCDFGQVAVGCHLIAPIFLSHEQQHLEIRNMRCSVL